MRVPIAYGLSWPERVASGALALDWNDEIVKGSAVTKDGAPVPRG